LKCAILYATPSVRERLLKTIFQRREVQVQTPTAPRDLLGVVAESPPDLLVLGLPDLDSELLFLDKFLKIHPDPAFPLVLIQRHRETPVYPDCVRAVFPYEFDTEEFDETVAELVGLPIRREMSFLVRLGVSLENPAATMLVNTVNLSPEGALVVSPKPLSRRTPYQMRLMGTRGVPVPVLRCRIAGEVEVSGKAAGHHYSVVFDGVDRGQMEAWIRDLQAK